jgi:hypothetical protein
MDEIDRALSAADLFVAIGTSGAVYPAAGFVAEACAYGVPTCEINLEAADNAHCFDEARYGPASETVQGAVAGALDDAATTRGDGRIEEVAPQGSEPRERAFLVGSSEARIAYNVGDENGGEFADFGHQGSVAKSLTLCAPYLSETFIF